MEKIETNTQMLKDSDEYTTVVMEYKKIEIVLSFPKNNQKFININNFSVSTDILYYELLDNSQTNIKEEIIQTNNNTFIEEIKSQAQLIQELISNFSLENILRKSITQLIKSIPLLLNLNLLSLVKIILVLVNHLIVEIKQYIDQDQETYVALLNAVAIIQNKMVPKMSIYFKFFNYLSLLFNECTLLLLFLLIPVNKQAVELFIDTIKKEYFYYNINHPSLIISQERYFLFKNIVYITIIVIISNKSISISEKIDLLLKLFYQNNKLVEFIYSGHVHNILELSHKLFSFYNENICSTNFTRAYVQEANKNDNIISLVNFIYSMKFDLNSNQEIEDDLEIENSLLIQRINTALFNHYIKFKIPSFELIQASLIHEY